MANQGWDAPCTPPRSTEKFEGVDEMAALDLELLENDNCAFFAEQRNYEAGLLKSYNAMLIAVGLAVTASIVGLIISIAVSEYGVAAATGIGTVVSGAAVKFILDRKSDAQDRLDKWVDAIHAKCP